MATGQEEEPPNRVVYELEEALDLLAALEDGRDVLIDTDHPPCNSRHDWKLN